MQRDRSNSTTFREILDSSSAGRKGYSQPPFLAVSVTLLIAGSLVGKRVRHGEDRPLGPVPPLVGHEDDLDGDALGGGVPEGRARSNT